MNQSTTSRQQPSGYEPFSGSESAAVTQLTISEIGRFARRHQRVLLVTPAVAVLLTIALVLAVPRSYTVSSAIAPQTGAAGSARLLGLAAQFGVNIPGMGEGGDTPELLAALLLSREALEPVVRRSYSPVPGITEQSANLTVLLDASDDTEDGRVDVAIRTLRNMITVEADEQTGVVRLAAKSDHPRLSLEITEALIDQVDRINAARRTRDATAERRFLEERVSESRSSLRAAEDVLQSFLQRNRVYRGSPELEFQYERLQRTVSLQQQLFTNISQAYEQAALEAIRNTPNVSVIEPPRMPLVPDRRGLLLKALLAIIAGSALGVSIAVLREMRQIRRAAHGA